MERTPLGRNTAGKTLLLITLALLALGVVMVHSAVASVAAPGPWYMRVDFRHTLFAILAAVVLLTCWRFDYRLLVRGRGLPVLLAVGLAVALACGLLVFAPGIGHSAGGYHRWIRLGPNRYAIGFQPSELIKLMLVAFLAAWLSRKSAEDIRSLKKTFLPAAGLIALCVGLVVTQDFGTAVLIAASAGVVLLLAGVRVRHLAMLVPPAAAGFYAMVFRVPHRWARITAFLDPWAGDNPSAYQPRQSLLAILSGGWFGQGVGRGMFKQGFLPEDSTDFIFSVLCEEWGVLGAVLLMGLIALWIYTVAKAAGKAGGFGRLLIGSLGFLIAMQAVLHIAVNLVVAPPTGIALPFVSAGGTALVLMAAATALIVSVTSRPSGELEAI